MTKSEITTVTIEDEGVSLAVYADYHDGYGPQFVKAYPTGIYATHPKAREHDRALAERLADALKAEILGLSLDN